MPRTVVTGMGVVAPTGLDAEQHWQSVLAGKSGIAPISRFDATSYPVRLAGQVAGFDAAEHVPSRLLPQTDPWSQHALYAAGAALADAGVDPAERPEYSMAVVTSSSSGGNLFGQREMEQLYRRGPSWVSAYQSIAWFYAATTGQISIRHGMRGPCGVVCAEQAGGLDAIAEASRLVAADEAGLVVTGGTDMSLSPYGLTAQLAGCRLTANDDPAVAYRPFDAEADGYLPGEGGAILVVEREDGARARGRTPYGVIAGHAAGFSPPRGRVLAGVVRRALAAARLDPGDIDVVFADGSGDPEADRAESAALAEVFGPRAVPVTVPKTLTGRLYGGGAPLDVATALLALRHGIVPATAGTSAPAAHHPIDLVTAEPRELPLRTALVVARGHGGFTSALVVTAADNHEGQDR